MFFSKVKIFAALIAATAVNAQATAQEEPADETAAEVVLDRTDAAVAFAKDLTDQATVALTAEDASEAERLSNFQAVLGNGLALETIGNFMLGESRKTMSEPQKERYAAVFPQYITKLYAEQFEDIVGKPLTVIEAKELGARDVIVRTEFERKDASPINVDWRVRKLRSGDQKAIDIIVGGVSIMLVKREEFSAFVAANGIDSLIDRLETEAV